MPHSTLYEKKIDIHNSIWRNCFPYCNFNFDYTKNYFSVKLIFFKSTFRPLEICNHIFRHKLDVLVYMFGSIGNKNRFHYIVNNLIKKNIYIKKSFCLVFFLCEITYPIRLKNHNNRDIRRKFSWNQKLRNNLCTSNLVHPIRQYSLLPCCTENFL